MPRDRWATVGFEIVLLAPRSCSGWLEPTVHVVSEGVYAQRADAIEAGRSFGASFPAVCAGAENVVSASAAKKQGKTRSAFMSAY
jgi:hypothetical protein